MTSNMVQKNLRAIGNFLQGIWRAIKANRLVSLFIFVSICIGVACRLWLLNSRFGSADSDESIVGLMALDWLNGNPSVFFWGQSYGGSVESMLAALSFLIFGVSDMALKIPILSLSVAWAIVLYRICKRIFEDRYALFVAAVSWSTSLPFVWLSIKERGFYGTSMLFGLLTILFMAKFAEKPSSKIAAIAGLFAGLAVWSSPQSLYMLIPGFIVLVLVCYKSWKPALFSVPGFLLGVSPIVFAVITRGPGSLVNGGGAPSTYFDRLEVFFQKGISIASGTQLFAGSPWFPKQLTYALTAGLILLLLFFLYKAFVFVRKSEVPDNVKLLVGYFALQLALYPFIFAISSFSVYVDDPRYIYFAWPPTIVAIVFALRKWSPIVLSGLLLLTVIGAVNLNDNKTLRYSSDVEVTTVAPLVKALDAKGIDAIYADYWIAYRVSLVTENRIKTSPGWTVRNVELAKRAEDDPDNTVLVVLADSTNDVAVVKRMQHENLEFQETTVGKYRLYELTKDLSGEDARWLIQK